MSYHYKLSPPTLRDLAFKYTLKSADQAIAQGAFGDGLYFSNDAVSLATTEAEVRILQDVVRAGVEDLTWNQSQQTPRSTTTLIKRTSIYNSSSEVKLMRDYTGLLQQVEDMLREYDPSEEDKKKALLMKNKSTMLTWQVSYAHAPSRQNRLSMQSNQLAAISGKTKTRKKNVSWFGFNKSPSSNSADMSNRYSTRFDEEGDDDDGDEGRDSGGVMRSPSRSPLRRAMSSSSGDLQYGTGAQTDCCVIM
ncbi:hypothetical protein EON65_27235 [archaeon]|nr:MAG: hypothetical protein EON65_27235 [archaeon]